MKRIFYVGIILIAIISNLNAQKLDKLMKDSTKSYYDIKKELLNNKDEYLKSTDTAMLKRYYRWDWFYSTRVDKKGDMKAIHKAMKKYMKGKDHKAGELKASGNPWIAEGPRNNGIDDDEGMIGRIECIWVDPNDTRTILIGTASNGMWKTTNKGISWYKLTPTIPGGVSSIAVDPKNNNNIYITTGNWRNGWYSPKYATGVWKSTNGGASWLAINNGFGNMDEMFIHKIILHPGVISGRLFAVADDAIYETTNYGAQWRRILTAQNHEEFRDFVIHPSGKGYMYASGINCFYFNNNGTWQNKSSTVSNTGHFRMAIDNRADGTLFGLVAENYNANGFADTKNICISSGNAINWTMHTKGYPTCNKSIDVTIRVAGDKIFVGGVKRNAMFEYKNGNLSSATTLSGLHADIRDICLPKGDGSEVFIATDGGISANTSLNGTDFEQINGNLQLNECYDIAIHESDENMYLIGCHDNGSFYNTSAQYWHAVGEGGDGGRCAIDANNFNRQYTTANAWVHYRTSAASTSWNGWDAIMNPENNIVSNGYNRSFDFHPTSSNIVYAVYNEAGKGKVAKSSDYGGHFNTRQPVVTEWGATGQIEIADANPNYMYFTTYDIWNQKYGHILRTSNGGATWARCETGLSNYLDDAPITDIETNKNNAAKVWIAFGGFNNKKVFHSPNYGANWYDRTYNLPDFPVNSLAYDYERGNLYAATDVGIYKLNDRSSTWVKQDNGIPLVMVSSLKINFKANKLVAATYGAGVWSMSLAGSVKSGITDSTQLNHRGIDYSTVTNLSSENAISIYPNPVKGISTVKISVINNEQKCWLSMYTTDGRLVESFIVPEKSKTIQLSKNNYAGGLYILHLQQGNKTISSQKVFINH